MLWKICYIGGCETAAFAARELKRYLAAIDPETDAPLMKLASYNPDMADALWVGRDPAFAEKLPPILAGGNPALDDAIFIDVAGNRGVITGNNPRSVLLAVYRYLTELGCAWVRPGADGEILPRKALGADRVYVRETPSYRHRSMEIEGSNSFDHVANLIDWIPKLGMNGLFIPFFAPFAFYSRWYNQKGREAVTAEETKHMVREHEAEIKKRGLLYHAIGHGWTTEPFGIGSNDWDAADQEIPAEYLEYFPMIGGKRGFFDGKPMLTNLCFSNPKARDIVTSYVAEYCKTHSEIDFLHFWFNDSYNSHCECENCAGTTPSDYYVTLLNEIDKKLTYAGLNTKIVFLLYYELLWAPEKERLNNPERFVMMFAPISRTFSKTYAQSDLSERAPLAPYARNRIAPPRSVEENVARLRKWQELFKGDGFIFDYHFFMDHYRDPGYAQISRTLFEDMKNLDMLGLNGTVNCQVTRAFFPTGLGLCMMAKAMWNKRADYDAESCAYYKAAFGDKGPEVKEYLETLSALFDPPYLRREKPQADAQAAENFDRVRGVIDSFERSTAGAGDPRRNATAETPESHMLIPSICKSWEYLRLHGQLCRLLAKALAYRARGKQKAAMRVYGEIESWIQEHESGIADALDFYIAVRVWKSIIESKTHD